MANPSSTIAGMRKYQKGSANQTSSPVVDRQPAAAQSYSGEYACPAGTVYDPTYGCTTAGADDFGYYDYPGGTVLYGRHGHGFGHMGIGAEGTIAHHGMGFGRSVSAARFGGDGFGHGMGRAVGVDRGF